VVFFDEWRIQISVPSSPSEKEAEAIRDAFADAVHSLGEEVCRELRRSTGIDDLIVKVEN